MWPFTCTNIAYVGLLAPNLPTPLCHHMAPFNPGGLGVWCGLLDYNQKIVCEAVCKRPPSLATHWTQSTDAGTYIIGTHTKKLLLYAYWWVPSDCLMSVILKKEPTGEYIYIYTVESSHSLNVRKPVWYSSSFFYSLFGFLLAFTNWLLVFLGSTQNND